MFLNKLHGFVVFICKDQFTHYLLFLLSLQVCQIGILLDDFIRH